MPGLIIVTLLLVHISAVRTIAKNASQPLSSQLYKDLMADYQPVVLPLYNNSNLVGANFGMALQQIQNVDIHSSRMTVNIWLSYQWKDPRLSWNVSEANGVRSIRIKEGDLWMPDIRLYNSLSVRRMFDTSMVVYSDGTCSFVPVEEVTAPCSYDLTWFPYDTQSCSLKYGSWTYDGTKVNLTKMYRQIDISTYQPHEGWDLIAVPMKRSEWRYDCCKESYIDIKFTVEIKRRGSKYTFEYVTPAVILTFLIPLLFLLPSDNSSRFALGAGMLVSIMLLMSMLSNVLPSELIKRPKLGVYYDMMFILVSVALAVSSLISTVSSKSTEPSSPPSILKCVVQNAAYEWRPIGRVLDRLCLLIFFTIIVIGSLAILPK